MKKLTFWLSSLAVLIALLFSATAYRQQIKDFAVVKSSELPPQSQALLNDLSLTPHAEFIFKASRPEIQAAEEFNRSCSSVAREHSIVLGCYTKQRFFVFDVKDERLAGVKEVTAAHELLHAVYERMSQKDKDTLEPILISTAESIADERFRATINEYRNSEPDQLANEYHSILATEIEVLPTTLEQHFSKFFKDRKKIVAYAKQYESAFSSLDQQIKDYDASLKNLREQKNRLETQLNIQQSTIESEQQRLSRLRAEGQIAAYNNAVPGYNAKIESYNNDVARLKQIVSDYNELVEKRNALATTQNNLVKQLDSNFQSISSDE